MPLPLIIVAALVATGGGGVAAGADGARRMHIARGKAGRAGRKRERVVEHLELAWLAADAAITSYGEVQLRIQRDTVGDFARWLQDNQRKVRAMHGAFVDGVEVVPIDLPELQVQVFEAEQLLGGGLGAAAAGFAARQAALTGVRMAATAGTGTAISGLTGAAANSATLAWLGGGTLASGGGGVAAGASVLTGVGIAPALLISGLALNAQGHRALTQARQAEALVAVNIASMRTDIALLLRLQRRVNEMRELLEALDLRARRQLAELVDVDFDVDVHAELFMRTAQLIQALREVLSTPVITDDGDVTEASRRIVIKYRDQTATAA